ncbi:MAG: PAS domain-containing protein [Kiloniellaceae bacterium]
MAGSEGTVLSRLIGESDLLRLIDYWRGKRGGRPMPSRSDIDPIEIDWALARLSLLDYDPADGFRYRLAGAEPSGVFGRGNLKGLTFRDLMSPEGARFVEDRWTPVVAERSVCCMKGMIYLGAERTAIGERVVLPLADGADAAVTGVLAMSVFGWVPSDQPQAVQEAEVEYIPVEAIP